MQSTTESGENPAAGMDGTKLTSAFISIKREGNSLHAWSIDKSGHEYELKEKDFTERGLGRF